ncbi:MAG: SUMF1/EgtB/PvdO family nonheme iron enzyme [Bradymonadia bacterium]
MDNPTQPQWDLDELRSYLEMVRQELSLPVGTGDMLAITQLIEGAPDLLQRPEALRDSVVALIARTPEEQARLGWRFDHHFSRASGTRDQVQPTQAQLSLGLRRVLTGVSVCLVAAIGWWLATSSTDSVEQSQPSIPEPSPPPAPTAPTPTLNPEATQPTRAFREIPRPDLMRPRQIEVEAPVVVFSVAEWLLGALGVLFMGLGGWWLRAPARAKSGREAESRAREEVTQHEGQIAERRRAALIEAQEKALAQRHRRSLQFLAEPPFDQGTLVETAVLLSRLGTPATGDTLDVEETIEATLERGGAWAPVMQAAPQQISLTVLLDVESRQSGHIWLGALRRLLQTWRKMGVPLRVYEFELKPDYVRAEGSQRLISLGALARDISGPLLICSRQALAFEHSQVPKGDTSKGAGSRQAKRATWSAYLGAWSTVAWLDPSPISAQDRPGMAAEIKMLEAEGLARFPTTPRGLIAMARFLSAEGRHREEVPWHTPPERPEAPSPEVDVYDEAMALWRLALAVSPMATWDQMEMVRTAFPKVTRWFDQPWHVWWLVEDIAKKGQAIDGRGFRGDPTSGASTLHIPFDWWRGWKLEAARTLAGQRMLNQVHDYWRRVLSARLSTGEEMGYIERVQLIWSVKFHTFRADPTPKNLKALMAGREGMMGDEIDRWLALEMDCVDAPDEIHPTTFKLTEALATLSTEIRGEGEQALGGFIGLTPRWWPSTLAGRAAAVIGCACLTAAIAFYTLSVGLDALASTPRVVSLGAQVPFDVTIHQVVEVGEGEPSGPVQIRQSRLRPNMVVIQPGYFTMGSPEEEEGRYDNETQYDVRLSRRFLVGETEVTQGQWKALMKQNPSHFYRCGDDCPVENVSWFDVIEYLNRLSEAESLEQCYRDGDEQGTKLKSIDCKGYRLPTEAEWEYMARSHIGGDVLQGATYSMNDWSIVGEHNAPALDSIAWYGGNSGVSYEGAEACIGTEWAEKQYPDQTLCGPHPVAQKEPNFWGVYDVLGNVVEWTGSSYRSKAFDALEQAKDDGVLEDPFVNTQSGDRVIRGGAWAATASDTRLAVRGSWPPNSRYYFLGFRPVRTSY